MSFLQASITEDLNMISMYISLAGIYLVEIFVIIYFANEISLKCDQLNYRLFESNWTYMSIKWQKVMIIFCEKWKNPKEFIVGKIFTMRIDLLTSVVINWTFYLLQIDLNISISHVDIAPGLFNIECFEKILNVNMPLEKSYHELHINIHIDIHINNTALKTIENEILRWKCKKKKFNDQ